jgi:hypothetical protein
MRNQAGRLRVAAQVLRRLQAQVRRLVKRLGGHAPGVGGGRSWQCWLHVAGSNLVQAPTSGCRSLPVDYTLMHLQTLSSPTRSPSTVPNAGAAPRKRARRAGAR